MTGNATSDVTFTLAAERLSDRELISVAVEASQVIERSAQAMAAAMVDPTKDPKAAAQQLAAKAAVAQRKVAGVIYAIASELIARRDVERRTTPAGAGALTEGELDELVKVAREQVQTGDGTTFVPSGVDVLRVVDELRRLRTSIDVTSMSDTRRRLLCPACGQTRDGEPLEAPPES